MNDTTSYHPLPQPSELTEREKEDAMGAYLMMFAAIGAGLPLPIINLIAAIVYYYINRSGSRFVRFHSFQALISQIPTTLMNAFGIFWALRIYFTDEWVLTDAFKGYVVAVLIANLVYFIFGIVSAVKARKGRFYYLMFFGKIAYQKVFVIKEEQQKAAMNVPPKM